jgi:hypothetical protein
MTLRTVDATTTPAAPAIPLWMLVTAAVYVVVLTVGAKLLGDADTYWHIFVGNWTLAHGLPSADPFSFTFAGKPWIAKEWLSQVVLATASNLGGWTLVVAATAAAAALAFGLLARFLAERLSLVGTVALVVAAFILAAPHLLARPHVLALPVMVAWVAGLARAAERGRAPPYALLALMVLWANLHAGFPLGILMVGAFGLDAVVAAAPAERYRTARTWAVFALLTVVAAMVTPYGPQSMIVTFQILNLGPALSIIGEWKAVDFSHLSGMEAVLLAGLGLAVWRGFSLPWPRVLILLGLLHLALSAERNGELLGLLAPLALATPIARQVALARASGPATANPSPIVAAAMVAVLAAATLGLAAVTHYAPTAQITPAGALNALAEANAKRVFNDYGFGGYMIASGVAPFIDGRTELYGGTFTARHDAAVNLRDLPGFLAMLDTYAIDATLLAPDRPAVALLDRLPEWKRLYADDVAVAHVRK